MDVTVRMHLPASARGLRDDVGGTRVIAIAKRITFLYIHCLSTPS